jgi:serine/threonine-protein kinase SRPK3
MYMLANWVSKHTVDVIEPIALRAPEVILGAKWGPSAEIWGLGCVVSQFTLLVWAAIVYS